MRLIESIIEHEGFSKTAYPDPLSGGKPYTFGHGLTYITEYESEWIVARRINEIRKELSSKLIFFIQLPIQAQEILIEMAYQIGVSGVLKFKKTIQSLKNRDYIEAAEEMIDSRWARQTPRRAHELAARMAGIANE